ncbi:MAG: hypothetical protein ACYDAI_03840 [Trichloromonadaceae bacterium]
MKELNLQDELIRLQKEFHAFSAASEHKIKDLRTDLDRCRLELKALETFFGSVNPSFVEQFPQVLERTVRESNFPLD